MKRLRRQVIACLFGGIFLSFVQLLIWPQHPPVLAFVLGGLLGFGVSEAMTAAE